MKLINFLVSPIFNNLREKMDAPLIEYNTKTNWEKINLDRLLEELKTSGIDVDINDVDIIDETFEYKGQKVILYIRDTFCTPEEWDKYETPSNKFHVANCTTIQKFIRNKKINRYVVSTRSDGNFIVNIFNRFNRDEILSKNHEGKLDVCKNCIRTLNKIKNDLSESKWIFKGFSLDLFFEKFKSKEMFYKKPIYTEKNSPLNKYDDNFSKISKEYRDSKNWICESCNINLQENKKLLHTHHIDFIKSNNSPFNLQALCIYCHAKKSNHSQLKKSPDYNLILEIRNSLKV